MVLAQGCTHKNCCSLFQLTFMYKKVFYLSGGVFACDKQDWAEEDLEKHTIGNTMWKVCAIGISNFSLATAVVCQEISLHPLNTPSRTHHPDNAMSKEYQTVIPRFPLGSSHP